MVRFNPQGYWTRERVLESALEHKTVSQWQRAEKGAYLKALKLGWLDDCTRHMKRGKNARLTHEEYQEWVNTHRQGWRVLEPYQNSSTPIRHACPEGHQFEWRPERLRAGFLCPLCSDHTGTDADAVYVWEWIVDGEGTGIYKAGLTSWRLGDRRIRACAAKNEMDYRLIFVARTDAGGAVMMERVLHNMGNVVTDLPEHIVDGRTEFRRYNEAALESLDKIKRGLHSSSMIAPTAKEG